MKLLSSYYFFFFVAFGALYTMLPLFLEGQGLSKQQASSVLAAGPVVTVLFQPVWGMICDRYNAQHKVLIGTLIAAAAIGLVYSFGDSYPLYLLLFAGMAMFHSSGVPILDSISLSYTQKHGGDYGSLRLWGAIGFAVASWGAGAVAEATDLSVIFYLYSAALIVCVFLTRGLPREGTPLGANILHGLKQLLLLPRYLLLMLSTFLVFGAIQANNALYGFFFTAIGGTVAGVGLSFLIAAGSEAPVMRVAGRLIRRFGLIQVLIAAAVVSSLRWVYYGTEPSATIVMWLLFVQGISVGLYLPAAAQLVREVSPQEIQVTALGIYSAVGHGLGAMTWTMAGGFIADRLGIFAAYSALGIVSWVGVAALVVLFFISKRHRSSSDVSA
jgi:PPP family 3-phenylpropionic acid transporter